MHVILSGDDFVNILNPRFFYRQASYYHKQGRAEYAPKLGWSTLIFFFANFANFPNLASQTHAGKKSILLFTTRYNPTRGKL